MHHIALRQGFSSFFSSRVAPSHAKPNQRSPVPPNVLPANGASIARIPAVVLSTPTPSNALPFRHRTLPDSVASNAAFAPTAKEGPARPLASATTPSCASCSHKPRRYLHLSNRGLRHFGRT